MFYVQTFPNCKKIHDNLKIRNRPINKQEGRKKGRQWKGRGRARGKNGIQGPGIQGKEREKKIGKNF